MSRLRTNLLMTIAKVFLDAPDQGHWAYELALTIDRNFGTVARALRNMEDEGWLEGHWENTSLPGNTKTKRRIYRLSEAGAKDLRAFVET